MSTATTPASPAALAPLEMPGGPVARVPSLDELRRLTEVPDRRVVFRGVDWSFFYERLVDSIPEGSNIHVDFDGRDLEVMANGPDHEDVKDSLGLLLVKVVADRGRHPLQGDGRDDLGNGPGFRLCGVEADQCYYFLPEKRDLRRSKDVLATTPTPADLRGRGRHLAARDRPCGDSTRGLRVAEVSAGSRAIGSSSSG